MNMAQYFGRRLKGRAGDANAAAGIASRRGVEKIHRVDVSSQSSKFMATPVVELPFDGNYGPDEDNVDENCDTKMVNEISTKEQLRPIRFNLDADIENVPVQSELHGAPEELCLRHKW